MCSYLSYSVLSCYLAFVPSCFRALVLSCPRAFVLSCYRAFVLYCLRALVPSCYRAFVLYCPRAFVLSCYRAFVLYCLRALVLSCYRAFVLYCLRALLPSCYRALVPSCYRAFMLFGAYSIKKVLVKPIALDDSFNQLAYYRVLDSFYCCAVGANSCLFRGEMRCINLIVAEGVHGIAFPTGCIYL